ncbi:MAG: hypothetical protein AAGC74_08210 [Verrucomicrobiota bacterium]
MRSAVSLLALVSSLQANLVTSTLTVVNEVGFNILDVELDFGGFGVAYDQTSLSGTLDIRITIDPNSGDITTLELISGDLDATPLSFSGNLLFNNFPIGTYNATSSNLGGTVDTTTPPSIVNPLTGESPAEDHEFIFNEGTITGTALGTTVNENFATNPVAGNGKVGDFVCILSTLNAAASTSSLKVYDLTLEFPAFATNTFPVDGGSFGTVNVSSLALGVLKAEGQVAVPLNPYLAWASANGIPNAPFTADANNDGFSNGLTWALGYSHPTPICPLAIQNTDFILTPGPDGLQTTLTIETSTTLAANSFSSAPSANISTSSNPLAPGQFSPVTVSNLAGPTRFFRISAPDPAAAN